MSRLEPLLQGLQFARGYTLGLLQEVPEHDWFRMPGNVTHLAWQVGHVAFVQHRLALERIRGPRPDDERLIPDHYAALFGKGSVPQADEAAYPTPAAIRRVLDAVFEQILEEIPRLSDGVLDEPCEPRHPAFHDKCGALRWAANHEMLHAGQIGLLRRLLGNAPLR